MAYIVNTNHEQPKDINIVKRKEVSKANGTLIVLSITHTILV